jgi:hypothetical protein
VVKSGVCDRTLKIFRWGSAKEPAPERVLEGVVGRTRVLRKKIK